jgi:hypothetical protein
MLKPIPLLVPVINQEGMLLLEVLLGCDPMR